MQRQIDSVEQRDRGAERVARHGDGRLTVLREQRVNGREDRLCRPGFALRQNVGLREVRGRARQVGLLCMLVCESSVHFDRGGEAGEER